MHRFRFEISVNDFKLHVHHSMYEETGISYAKKYMSRFQRKVANVQMKLTIFAREKQIQASRYHGKPFFFYRSLIKKPFTPKTETESPEPQEQIVEVENNNKADALSHYFNIPQVYLAYDIACIAAYATDNETNSVLNSIIKRLRNHGLYSLKDVLACSYKEIAAVNNIGPSLLNVLSTLLKRAVENPELMKSYAIPEPDKNKLGRMEKAKQLMEETRKQAGM